ncbi:MAG TPA: hypothetical protein VMJ64_08850 [Anaerolineales bacterium]|nr:hypothetical protein [Anaerolineales bacterium]
MKDPNTYRRQQSLAETQPGKPHNPGAEPRGRERLEELLHDARTAPSTDLALEYMQQAVDIKPNDPRVISGVQLSVFNKLRSDPFVAYLAEADGRYVIRFRNSRPFTVPTARNEQEYYPPPRRTDSEKAMAMMWWILFGLIPAGLGAIILSPFAIRRGMIGLQRDSADPRQHRMAWTAIFLAFVLGLIGLLFGALLLLHFLLLG